MEGRRLGRYRITSKLAERGMGAVYLATHELMGREVVIKVLLPEMSTQRDIVQRFFNEARATGNLNHPGIVAIFDLDYADDGRWRDAGKCDDIQALQAAWFEIEQKLQGSGISASRPRSKPVPALSTAGTVPGTSRPALRQPSLRQPSLRAPALSRQRYRPRGVSDCCDHDLHRLPWHGLALLT
jgi:serine/threonine protein kinase